ncbi:MAG: pitrilysin family protein [Pelolinea sp.]|nr:pitrilysin family protein [Pelolinea sp.]
MGKEENILKNLPGPETIGRFSLPNGAVVLTFNNPSAQSINLVGLLENGAQLDPAEKLGVAHFTASMLSRGTTSKSFAAYHEILESRGAGLSFSSGTHQTWFHGKALAEDIGVLLELASDSLRHPTFVPDYVERMRQQLLAGLAIREQDTSEVASLIFDLALFPSHPYGNPVDGYIQTVQTITRQDLVDFHASYFQPEGMIMVIAGALEGMDVKALTEGCFADWQNNPKQIPALPLIPEAPKEIIRKHRFIEEKSQTDLILGTYGPTRKSDDFLPSYLGNNILGQFGLMGRIGESVRSKSGLAYHASSSVNAWADGGSWEFTAGLNPENLDKAIRLIQDEIERFTSEPVTAEELDDSQSNMIGRLPLSLESNAGIANAILTIERFNLGLDYYQHYTEIIRAITPQLILETAQNYLHPEKLVIASAGSGADIS